MKYVICYLSLVLPLLAIDQCRTKAGLLGTCSELRECSTLYQLSHIIPGPSLIKEYGGCGRRNNNIRLCCPNDPNTPNNDENTKETTTTSPVTTARIPVTTSSPATVSKIPVTTTTSPVTTSRTTLRPTSSSSSMNIRLNCKGEFTKIGGKCMFIGQEHGKWSNAEGACANRNAKLAVLNDVENVVQYLRNNKLGGSSAWYWVGANDKETAGTFRWSTGETVNGPWRDFKPWSNQPGRMCVYVSDEGLGKTPCLDATWYMCET